MTGDGCTSEDGHGAQDEPLLGLATTRSLLEEIEARMHITQNSTRGRELGRLCQEALENLDRGVLNYSTVRPDPVEPVTPPVDETPPADPQRAAVLALLDDRHSDAVDGHAARYWLSFRDAMLTPVEDAPPPESAVLDEDGQPMANPDYCERCDLDRHICEDCAPEPRTSPEWVRINSDLAGFAQWQKGDDRLSRSAISFDLEAAIRTEERQRWEDAVREYVAILDAGPPVVQDFGFQQEYAVKVDTALDRLRALLDDRTEVK